MGTQQSRLLLKLHQDTLQLARKVFVEELRQEQQCEKQSTEHHRKGRRSQLMAKLKRLRPGASSALPVVSDAAELADCVRDYLSS